MPKLGPHLQMAASHQQIMSLSMQQSLHILAMPLQELKEYLEKEIEKNPAIDYELAPLRTCINPDQQYQTFCLRDHLLAQAREFFSNSHTLQVIDHLIGCMEPNGYITMPSDELAKICHTSETEVKRFIKIIQTFDPPGIGAKNLQESLLIQLRLQGKDSSLTYIILRDYFPELLQSRFLVLQKKLKKSPYEIQRTLQKELKNLNFHPTHIYETSPSQIIVPDLLIDQQDSVWRIRVYHSDLPKITLKKIPEKEKKVLKNHILQAKNILSGLKRRKKMLQTLAVVLIEKQGAFFEGKGPIIPLDLKKVAQELCIHESTLSRALYDKYLECPKGLVPLRSFFSRAYLKKSEKNVSRVSALEMLKKIIEEEDKTHPLSDQQLVEKLRSENFPCARRTVTKYRKKLSIGSRQQRRQFVKDESTML